MNFFFFNPVRFGHYEVIASIILKLNNQFKNCNISLLAFEKKSFKVMKKNTEINDILSKYSEIKFYPIKSQNIFLQILSRIKMRILVLQFLMKIIFSKRSIIFLRNVNTKFEKIIKMTNSLKKGKTYIIPSAINTFEESYERFFFNQIRSKKELNQRNIVKKDCADGYLYFSNHNLNFLRARGYNKFLQIGYPLGFREYIGFIKKNSKKYLKKELGISLKKQNTITIQINKYNGKWAGKDEKWVIKRIIIILGLVSKKFKKINILIRIHPTVDLYRINYLKKNINKLRSENINIYFSDLNSSTLADLSCLTIGLCTSSVFLHSLFMDVPYVEFSEFTKEQMKIFPSGACNTKFGVLPASNESQLREILFSRKQKDSLRLFKSQIDIKKNNAFNLDIE